MAQYPQYRVILYKSGREIIRSNAFTADNKGPLYDALTQIARKIENDLKPAGDPVGDFHRSKGCCDGSDPSGCWNAQREAELAEQQKARENARRERAIAADEYAGAEPSEGDMAFCPFAPDHSKLKMGFACKACGYVA